MRQRGLEDRGLQRGVVAARFFVVRVLRAVIPPALLAQSVPGFAFEDQIAQIAHPLGIKNAVEMIAFVLHDAGVKALGGARDRLAFEIDAAIADMGGPLDKAAQARHRQAALPAAFRRGVEDLDLGIDQHGQRRGVVEALCLGQARSVRPSGAWNTTTLSGTWTWGAARPAPSASIMVSIMSATRRRISGRGGVGDRVGLAGQDRMAHAGDFQDSHGRNMGPRARRQTRGLQDKRLDQETMIYRAIVLYSSHACARPRAARLTVRPISDGLSPRSPVRWTGLRPFCYQPRL